jgi:hypothetical protein
MTPAELSAILFDAIDYDGNDPHTKQSHRAQGYAELYGGDTVDLNKVAQAVHSAAIAPLEARIAELEAQVAKLTPLAQQAYLSEQLRLNPPNRGADQGPASRGAGYYDGGAS